MFWSMANSLWTKRPHTLWWRYLGEYRTNERAVGHAEVLEKSSLYMWPTKYL